MSKRNVIVLAATVLAAFALAACKNSDKASAKDGAKAAGCCAQCPEGCTCGGTGSCCKKS